MLYGMYRYSRWDGTQEIMDLDVEELMEHLSDDLLAHGDIRQALRELMRRGLQNRQGQRMPGLDDLLQQLRDRRQDQLQQYNMDAVMEDINQRLEEILKTERAGIQKRLGEARREM